MNKLLRYLLLICVVVLCGGASYGQKTEVTDVLTAADFVSQSGNYMDYDFTSSKTGAKYVAFIYGVTTKIQMNSKKNKGLITSVSGGVVKSIKIEFESKNSSAVKIYGSKKAYTATADVVDASKQGTLIKTVENSKTAVEVPVSDSYNYVAFASAKGVLYISKITIVWEKDASTPSKTSTTLSFGEGLNGKTYNCTVGKAFAAPTATLTPTVEGAKITYSSNKPEVATVDALTGAVTLGTTAGTAVITASYAGNDKYEAAKASYTINLTKPFEVEDGVFDFTESCDYGSGLTPTNDNNADYATSSKWTAKNVSFETSEGKGVRWWINGAANELRVYGNTKFKISVPEDKFITLIDIDGVNSGLSVDCGTFNSGKWSGWSQTVVFTNGNARKDIKKITVKYIAKESVTPITNGYATFACSYPVNYSENGLTAYTIKVDEDNQKVAYTEFTGVVPAGKAVLVSGIERQKYELTPATEKADATFATDLKVSDGTIKSDGTNFYGFTTKDGVSGFVRVAKDVAVPLGKGYLQLTGNTAAAPVFYSINIGGGTTGIGQVEVEKATENGAIYNLAGQRVDASYKGVVIKNGKKYVNK